MDEGHGYRVELRAGGTVEALGPLAPGMFRHWTALDPFLSRLRLDGRAGDGGELVLVDAATGRDVARRRFGGRPPRR